jgi:hypothetical protein
MTCLVVSALLFSPFAWKVGAALSLLGAFLMAAAFMSVCVVGHEADLQSEAQYRRLHSDDVEVEPMAIAEMSGEMNVEVR